MIEETQWLIEASNNKERFIIEITWTIVLYFLSFMTILNNPEVGVKSFLIPIFDIAWTIDMVHFWYKIFRFPTRKLSMSLLFLAFCFKFAVSMFLIASCATQSKVVRDKILRLSLFFMLPVCYLLQLSILANSYERKQLRSLQKSYQNIVKKN